MSIYWDDEFISVSKKNDSSTGSVEHSEILGSRFWDNGLGEELCHYGIKGMHWGIIRTAEQLGHVVKSKAKSAVGAVKKKVEEAAGGGGGADLEDEEVTEETPEEAAEREAAEREAAEREAAEIAATNLRKRNAKHITEQRIKEANLPSDVKAVWCGNVYEKYRSEGYEDHTMLGANNVMLMTKEKNGGWKFNSIATVNVTNKKENIRKTLMESLHAGGYGQRPGTVNSKDNFDEQRYKTDQEERKEGRLSSMKVKKA